MERRTRRPLPLSIVVLVVLLSVGCDQIACQKAPPNLTPRGTQAFYNTKVIKALDVLRDVVVSASEQSPPLVKNDDMRKVVLWHQSALETIKATPTGWQGTVNVGLDETVKNLPPDTQALVRPYVSLIKVLLAEVQ